jgi:hypothetical protein
MSKIRALLKWLALVLCSMLAGCLSSLKTLPVDPGIQRAVSRSVEPERCLQPLGSIVLVEPSAPTPEARQQALASMPALRQLVAQSGCFVLVERGTGHQMRQERQISRDGSHLQGRQEYSADFTLQPHVDSSVEPTGTFLGGFLSGNTGNQRSAAAGADVASPITARARLILVDNRAGVQVSYSEGSANRVPAPSASAPGANVQVVAALADSFDQTVRALRAYRSSDPVVPGLATLPARHVNFDAPRAARPAQTFAVQVWLSELRQTPEAKVEPPPAQQLRPDGQLVLAGLTDRPNWNIEVALAAPGFDFANDGSNQATVALAGADSSPARFVLVAREGETGRRTLRATLWYEGAFLGSVSREIEIRPERPAADVAAHVGAPSFMRHGRGSEVIELATGPQADAASRVQPLAELQPRTPDLTILLEHEDPRRLGRVHVVLSSPHMNGLMTERWDFPADAEEWLASWMDRLQRVPHGGGNANIATLRGLGGELYERLTPPKLRHVLAELGPAVSTIQVFSNNPAVPWELMRPGRVGPRELDFLGTSLRLARWPASADGQVRERPPQQIVVRELVVVAPEYAGDGQLSAQREEVAFLSQLRGYRLAPGTFAGMEGIAGSPPRGIVHFAGHGEMTGANAAQRRYHLKLSDGRLDAVAWRGLPRPAKPAPSLYFFNACELGAVESQAGAAAGWAPAVLDGGAGGYIGGMWPLQDGPASGFAKHFYADLRAEGGRAQRVAVAEALRRARRLFYETGDPTYLAYVFYGDVNLEVTLP